MASKSLKQKRTMQAAAHNPAFAAKMGIPSDVAQEFEQADRAKAAGHNAISARKSSGNAIGKRSGKW